MIELIWTGPAKLGDLVAKTSLPENYYKNTGEKLICGLPFFEYNPYVIKSEDIHPNTLTRVEKRCLWRFSVGNIELIGCKTMAHHICKEWGLEKCYKTSPDLYLFKELKPYPRTLVINTTGNVNGSIPLEVLNYIKQVYKDYWITQIGSISDVDFESDTDARGCSWQDSARIIAESEIFIGPDSFCMWLAKCYPKIRKKIILINKNQERCENFWPRGYSSDFSNNPFDTWIEWSSGLEIYNTFESDYGMTHSYLEI